MSFALFSLAFSPTWSKWVLKTQNDFPEAIRAYEKSLDLRPQDLRVCYNLADAYMRAGHHHQALLVFKKSLGLSPPERTTRAKHGMAAARAAIQASTKSDQPTLKWPAANKLYFICHPKEMLAAYYCIDWFGNWAPSFSTETWDLNREKRNFSKKFLVPLRDLPGSTWLCWWGLSW